MDIGSAIKILRKRQGLSQKELAEKSGLSANALCSIERNGAFPTKDTIGKICSALSIPVSALLFSSITEEDVPVGKRVAFQALKEPMISVLMPTNVRGVVKVSPASIDSKRLMQLKRRQVRKIIQSANAQTTKLKKVKLNEI